MLKIRLQRVGRKNDPSFRVVLTDSKNGPRSGKFLEILGSYDARQGQPKFKADRIKHWQTVGAKLSPTVHNLLIDAKVIDGKKINTLPKRKPKAEAQAETKPESKATSEAQPEATQAKEAETKPETEAMSEATEVKEAGIKAEPESAGDSKDK